MRLAEAEDRSKFIIDVCGICMNCETQDGSKCDQCKHPKVMRIIDDYFDSNLSLDSDTHAHWIPYKGDDGMVFCCSNCKDEFAIMDFITTAKEFAEINRYCPSCGRRMNEEVKE